MLRRLIHCLLFRRLDAMLDDLEARFVDMQADLFALRLLHAARAQRRQRSERN